MEFYIPVSQSDIQSSVMHLCDPWPLPSACALQKKWRNWFIWFFSSPLKDNFMLMKNAAKESDIQRSPRSTRKELCSDVLSVMATVLCTLSRPGHPSLCWTKGLWTWDFILLPLWSPSLTASWSRDSGTALADTWYLSCASNYDQNPSHDQQPQLCCSSPGSFQGEGSTLTAWPQAHG